MCDTTGMRSVIRCGLLCGLWLSGCGNDTSHDSDKDEPRRDAGSGSGSAMRDAGMGSTGGGRDGGQGASGGPTAEPGTWPQMGYDANNHYHNPTETALSVDNAATLTEKWRFQVAGMPPGTPVVAEGKVFVMSSGGTYAINLADGTQAWARMDVAGTASIAYAGGAVYAHTNTARLFKLSAADGADVWPASVLTYDLGGCDGTSSPIVAAGHVIVGHSCGVLEVTGGAAQMMARGGVEAFKIEDGARSWTYFTVPETGENGAMVWSSVGIDAEGGTVFASTGNNYTVAGENSDSIHAINLADGLRKWKTQVRTGDVWSIPRFIINEDTDFGANPILGEIGGRKIVAAGDKGATFWMMDRETGEILWSREGLSGSSNQANGGVLMNGAFDGRNFYAVSNDPASGATAVLRALDGATGEDVWPPKTLPKLSWGAPSLANGVLVVPNDTILYVLDAATGEELIQFDTGGTIAAGAASIADGNVIVGSGLQYPFAPTARFNDKIICYSLP